MKFFIYDDVSGNVVLNEPEILLTSEFATLYEKKRNISKTDKTGEHRELAFKEFTYIYLYIDWQSPYATYSEEDKHNESLKDSKLTNKEYDDLDFKNACKKYEELQESNLPISLLLACRHTVKSVIDYLINLDVSERNPLDGKPIFKTKDVIAEIKGSKDLISSIKELEAQVKKEIDSDVALRGDAEPGMFD